jgi:hypothetical protein
LIFNDNFGGIRKNNNRVVFRFSRERAMKSDSGASYESPLVLEAGPEKKQPASVATSNTPVTCIDSDSEEEDRKPPAKPSKRPRTPQLLNPGPSTTLTPHRPWASLDSDIEEEDADAALARQLQEQEWASPLSKQDGGSPMSIDSLSPTQDATLAAALDMNDDDLNQLSMQSDASLAAQLQQEEHEHKNQRVQAEHHAMSQSLDGRAWLFVNQVLDLHKRLSTTVAPEPQTVAVDGM